jgi:hypothetical protein
VIRPTKKLHYWDSCVFLAFLKNEKDKINDCISVLKAAENGQVIIVTSALQGVTRRLKGLLDKAHSR